MTTLNSQTFGVGNGGNELDDLLGKTVREQVTSAFPALLIGIGGTGANVLRRVKDRVNWLNMAHFCRFLVLDTDESVRHPTGLLPGFENDEFCYLNMSQVKNVINRPDEHPILADRLDLRDVNNRLGLANIASTRARHAGQIRPFGLMSLHANFRTFQNRLSKAVSDLKSRWSALEHEQAGEQAVNMEKRFYAVIVGSVCGGTGAGVLIDVAALLRRELEDREEPEVAAFLTLPEVYEDKLRGKPDEYRRIMANAYATIKEIDYFEHQEAREHHVELGGSEETRFVAPPGLFEHCHFIQRIDADGNDLKSTEAVYDTIALHIIAEVGSTIGGKIAAGNANDVARTGLVVCPTTRRQRRYSTIGASALALPQKRLLYHCVYRHLTELLDSDVLGPRTGKAEIEDEVARWLVTANLEQRKERDNSDRVVQQLKARSVAGLDGYINALFKKKTPQTTMYHGNRDFVVKYDESRQKWKDTQFKRIRDQLVTEAKSLYQTARDRVHSHILGDVFRTHGWRGALSFGVCLEQAFSDAAVQLNREAKLELERALKWDTNAKQECASLRGFLSQLGTNKAVQDNVALHFRRAIDAAVEGEAKKAAAWVMTSLADDVEKLLAENRKAIDSTEEYLEECCQRAKENRAGGRGVTTDSQAEIDVSTPEFFERFFHRQRGDKNELLKKLAANLGKTETDSLLALGSDPAAQNELRTLVAYQFLDSMKGLNIMRVLEDQLGQSAEERRYAKSRVQRALAACQPLWQGNIGVSGDEYYFSDMVILGTPEESAAEVDEELKKLIDTAKASLSMDARYQADIDMIPTNDPHRIYAVRVSHGGRPHYLFSWEKYHRAYDMWRKKQAHPIHVFAQRTVAKMPALEPMDPASEGERAFALGNAYGWIARRGNRYLFNLSRRNDNGSSAYEVPILPYQDCVTFENNSMREKPGSVQLLLDRGILHYGLGDESNSDYLLAQGRNEAVREFTQGTSKTKLVLEVFDKLCDIAGNDKVCRELEGYVDQLSTTASVKDRNYHQVMREVDLLRQQIGILNISG